MLSVKNKIINLSLIDHYTKNQNVALLAFGSILDKKSEEHIISQLYLEDMKMSLELFLYDLQSIDTLLNENTEYFLENVANIKTFDYTYSMIDEQKKQALLIEKHLKDQNVALLALYSAQANECNGILKTDSEEDFKNRLILLTSNLNSIYDNMLGSMEYLWEIKDKIATKRKEIGIYPLFSFKQQEDPLEDNQPDVIATCEKKKTLTEDISMQNADPLKISKHFDGIFKQVLKLEALKAVAKGGKFSMSTDYAQGLSREEIADCFEGIALIAEPIINDLYELQNEESREAFEYLHDKGVLV